uniref:Chemokine (C-X-C motif) ligand 12a (stromal cell-derived factor 1) n=1 Tax=Neogobius melanostomus TaxID=47308 RepID=A0A8C6TT17_9GOBI
MPVDGGCACGPRMNCTELVWWFWVSTTKQTPEKNCLQMRPRRRDSVGKPISLVERCYCRSTVNNLPRSYIRELRFIQTPNCPFQVVAKLKTNKEVCVNPAIRWLQQYLKNAINKMKKSKQTI